MKTFFKISLIVILLMLLIFALQNYPSSSEPKTLARVADTTHIRTYLEEIINTSNSRNYLNVEVLDSIADLIKREFSKSSKRVIVQKFEAENRSYSNIIASFGPEAGERIIVGAHYDVCGEENSQVYPLGFLKWFYGSKGNYITIVQKSIQGDFSKQFKELAFKNNSILTKSFRAPSFFGGIDLSDQRNYWKFGYSALMITNTSFYRNSNYHQKGDVLDNLNIPNIGLVIDGVFRVLKEIK